MRYRALAADGDYVFGRGRGEFLVDSREAVAQAIRTRLLLWTDEWFLDRSEGTPYAESILGEGTFPIYDQAIKDRILGTEGVTSIEQYVSFLDEQRKLNVFASVNSQFGLIGLSTVSPLNAPGILDVNFVLDISTLG